MTVKSIFVTGTDTGSGKTVASIMLMRAYQRAGLPAYGMKPVASGCLKTATGLISEDALQLIENSTQALPYALVNPVALEHPCSPNIAAQLEDRVISCGPIEIAYRQLLKQEGILIVEGIGGWQTPVFGMSGMEVLVKKLGLPVVLVIGLRLGCISHALLTLESIQHGGMVLAGWIANQVDPDYLYSEQTVSCLQERMPCALLGQIPHLQDTASVQAFSGLDIRVLL